MCSSTSPSTGVRTQVRPRPSWTGSNMARRVHTSRGTPCRTSSLHFSPRGEAKWVRGPSGRGASRLARAGVLEQYVEHGKQAQRSHGGRIACFDRRVVRNAGYSIVAPSHGGVSTRDFIVELTRFVKVATTNTEAVRYAAELPMIDFEDGASGGCRPCLRCSAHRDEERQGLPTVSHSCGQPARGAQ